MQVYNIDESIVLFFATVTSVRRQECDAYVQHHYTGSARPVPLQGCFSHTVVVRDTIIQFRQKESVLDKDKMELVRQAAMGFSPDIQYRGVIGKERSLHVYVMNRIPGEMYVFARDASIPRPFNVKSRQQNTVQDLARFFAQSWNHGRHLQPPPDITPLVAEYSFNMGRLRESLPSFFSGALDSITAYNISTISLRPQGSACNNQSKTYVQEKTCPKPSTLLSRLKTYRRRLPHVITHEDLGELNFLIDPETGHITGIIDWAEMRRLPFGLGLCALENILGFMDNHGWHYFDNHEELRSLFWTTFRLLAECFTEEDMVLVRITRLVGLFRRHGFLVDGPKILGVVGEINVSALRYLDAFCLEK